jgi:hypothetical protein
MAIDPFKHPLVSNKAWEIHRWRAACVYDVIISAVDVKLRAVLVKIYQRELAHLRWRLTTINEHPVNAGRGNSWLKVGFHDIKSVVFRQSWLCWNSSSSVACVI